MTGTVPNAVVKRSERARKAGWSDSISVRVRDGRTSVLHRLRKDRLMVAATHIDGKAQHVWAANDETQLLYRSSFPELDALIRESDG